MPPDGLTDDVEEDFVASPAFSMWIANTFIDEGAPLVNGDHEHLRDARIGVLWTNAINRQKQRTVLATAEIPQAMAGGWKRARFELQIRRWFPEPIDFLLTFSATECRRLSDRAFCALVEHELYHCAQVLDQYDNPKFHRDTGLPMYCLRGHDVEEFVGVVHRYGAVNADVRALVAAAAHAPDIRDEDIAGGCGTCLSRAA